jgi:hypothetical protein
MTPENPAAVDQDIQPSEDPPGRVHRFLHLFPSADVAPARLSPASVSGDALGHGLDGALVEVRHQHGSPALGE